MDKKDRKELFQLASRIEFQIYCLQRWSVLLSSHVKSFCEYENLIDLWQFFHSSKKIEAYMSNLKDSNSKIRTLLNLEEQ